ncbi:MAG TPA: monovalent cation/H(+) antiporter subunit G [Thermoleophilaceae bacterium]|nr:monovalent cation/H(+) antiporter subunit G [Thermoleophilaceae bacterium]
MNVRHAAEYVLLVLGVGLQVLSAIGVLAMRSVYDRLHYVSSASVGGALVAVAVTVRESFSLIGNKTLFIAFFLLVTGPVLVHATARAARIRERGEWSVKEGEQVEVRES